MNTPTTTRKKPPYTPQEDAILHQHYNTASRETLLALLPGRTWKGIRQRAYVLDISNRPFNMEFPRWTDATEQLMRDLYPIHGGKHMANLLGRNKKAIYQKAMRMELSYIRRPKPPKPAKLPKPPKAARPPKPAPAPKPPKHAKAEPLPKMKAAPPTLANHTRQKALKAISEKANKCGVIYTADDIKKLPIGNPIRAAHTAGGDRAVRAYLQTAA